jgi:hypothetical protein
MATKTKQAKTSTFQEVRTLRKPLPKSFVEAAGMLRHHKKALEQHLEKVRREWDRQ